ncbi:MAG: FHA domain-containing protein [Planctomycetota bacterium]
MSRPPHLVIVQENREPARLPLVRDLTLGRDPEVAIAINDGYLSRRHCTFVRRGEEVFVRDLSSYNGTYVNGTKIHEECQLYRGDVLKVGRTRVFVEFGDEATSDGLRIHAPNLEQHSAVRPVAREKPTQLSEAYQEIAARIPPRVHDPEGSASWGSATRRAVIRPNDKTPFPPPRIEESAIARGEQSSRGQRSDAGIRVISQIVRVLANATDVHDFLDHALARVLEVIPAERGILMRLDPKKRSLYAECVKSAHKSVSDAQARRKGISHTIARKVIRERVSVLVDDATLDERFRGASSVQELQVRSILCVPLWLGDAVSGLIYMDNLLHAYAFTEQDRDILVAAANVCALGIQQLS